MQLMLLKARIEYLCLNYPCHFRLGAKWRVIYFPRRGQPSGTYTAFLGNNFVEKGTLTIREEDEIFTSMPGKVYCSGRSVYMSAWGISGRFKFYWLHFEVTCGGKTGQNSVLMLPQHTASASRNILFRCFANSYASRKIFIVAWRWNDPAADSAANFGGCAKRKPADNPGLRWRGKRSKSFVRGFICRFPPPRWRRSCTATPIIWGGFIAMFRLTLTEAHSSPAGEGGGKAADQRFAVAHRGGDEMRV
jgi:hypothetical protein